MSRIWLICVLMILSSLYTITNAQGAAYKASVSNEVVLSYENAGALSLSPDGGKLIFLRLKDMGTDASYSEIWMSNTNGMSAKMFLSEMQGDYDMPVWSADGTKIVFLKNSGFEIWQVNVDGEGETPLSEKKTEKYSPLYSSDGTKLFYARLGVDPPGIRVMDFVAKTDELIFSTTGLSDIAPPFVLLPDTQTLLVVIDQDILFINLDGTVKAKKTIKRSLDGREDFIITPNGKYLIIGNLLYDLATGEESDFLPDSVIRYKEAGKADLVGPISLSISKDGKKLAFLMEEPDASVYRARIKVLDLTWQ